MSKDHLIELSAITKDIVLLKLPTQKDLSELFIRFQEYYESPFAEIRGKIFTLGYLKKLYSERPDRSEGSGAFTYIGSEFVEGDWSGFNIPSFAIQPFIDGLFDPLTEYEAEVVRLFKYRKDKFYVIGTSDDAEDVVLDHEVCHGLYYTNDKYRKDVNKALSGFKLSNFKKLLKHIGYGDSVLHDEAHAYLSADFDHMVENWSDRIAKFKVNMDKLKPLHKKLRKIKAKYHKGL